MIMAVCGPGDKIIVPRNVHKSVMSAIVFSGAIPIFIHPELTRILEFHTELQQNPCQRHYNKTLMPRVF